MRVIRRWIILLAFLVLTTSLPIYLYFSIWFKDFPITIFYKSENQQLISQRFIREFDQKFEKTQSIYIDQSKTPIYVITPTYARLVQKAELTRLSYCFRLVPNVHWIVVEDSENKTKLVSNVLNKSMVSYIHLNIKNNSTKTKHKGVFQRNLGLEWLRNTYNLEKDEGVVYFADDDNTYDIELFEEMRETIKVSVWPVGLAGGLIIEKPISRNDKIVGWNAKFKPNRAFPIDMAGFAINLRLILQHPEANFKFSSKSGCLESDLLGQLITVQELEPRASNCSRVLVWHTKTQKPNLSEEKKLKIPTNLDIEV